MKLNNGKGWEAMKAHPTNYLTAAQHPPNSSAKALGGGADASRGGAMTPGLSTARLYAAQPPPPSPGKPVVSRTRDRTGVSGSGQAKRQSALGGMIGGGGDVGTITASTQAQFQNSAANLPHRLSHAQSPALGQRTQQNDQQQQQPPTGVQKFLKAICCSR